MVSNAKDIERIKEIIEEYACNPDDYDLTKTAAEIYELARADLVEEQEDRWLALRTPKP